MIFVPEIYHPSASLYLEIETISGERVLRGFAPSRRAGISAIKDILSQLDISSNRINDAFANVLGPAVQSINKFRIANVPDVARMTFGIPTINPQASIVVPLYGRVDFLEYQLALFEDNLEYFHEIIYVLDDPARRKETIELAASCFTRFGRPFTLLLLGHNVGFAPANNIGLAHARGSLVCFLNSDVFPDTPDWLERLIRLASDPSVGIAGARLIYEDGTLQHDGCILQAMPNLGNWRFPTHPNKGLAQKPDAEPLEAEMVTGACMVMRTKLARDLGGFDESYIVGDFEDADLCKRVASRGLRVVVEPRAQLFHLERQSQDLSGSWRFNLTLYNAWCFNSRWVA